MAWEGNNSANNMSLLYQVRAATAAAMPHTSQNLHGTGDLSMTGQVQNPTSTLGRPFFPPNQVSGGVGRQDSGNSASAKSNGGGDGADGSGGDDKAKRSRGRPPGSKDKKPRNRRNIRQLEAEQSGAPPPEVRQPGRPRGSKDSVPRARRIDKHKDGEGSKLSHKGEKRTEAVRSRLSAAQKGGGDEFWDEKHGTVEEYAPPQYPGGTGPYTGLLSTSQFHPALGQGSHVFFRAGSGGQGGHAFPGGLGQVGFPGGGDRMAYPGVAQYPDDMGARGFPMGIPGGAGANGSFGGFGSMWPQPPGRTGSGAGHGLAPGVGNFDSQFFMNQALSQAGGPQRGLWDNSALNQALSQAGGGPGGLQRWDNLGLGGVLDAHGMFSQPMMYMGQGATNMRNGNSLPFCGLPMAGGGGPRQSSLFGNMQDPTPKSTGLAGLGVRIQS